MRQCRQWARTILFLLVFALLFFAANPLFIPQEELRREKAAFYQQPANTLDVVYIGSSSMVRAVSPMEIWYHYGIPSYSLATTLQAPVVTLAFLEDMFKTQQPQVVVFGFEWLFQDYDYAGREAYLRFALDPMPNSWTKLKTAAAIVRNDPSQSFLSYLFPMLRYHTRWSELDTYSLPDDTQSVQMGYLGLGQSRCWPMPQSHMASTGVEPSFSEESLYYYRQAIALCQARGVEVLLVKFPRLLWSAEEAQAQQAFADEMGIPLLDFNQPEYWEALSLDHTRDFYDTGHLSASAASRLSRFLGTYLQEHYDLTDKRSQGEYAAWNEAAPEYFRRFACSIHADYREWDAVYQVELSSDYLELYDLQPEDFTYHWTLYRDGTAIEEVADTASNQFSPALSGPGTYAATCQVFQNGVLLDTLSSLEKQYTQ